MKRRVLPAGLGAAAAVAVVAGAVVQGAVVPAAQASVAPGVVAVSQLQNLINTVRGETSTFTGIWISGKTSTVYVSAPSSSVTAAKVAALEPQATTARAATMKLVVVHAKYNFAQLEKIDGRVMGSRSLFAAAKASHETLSQWYPDPETDKIVIGFTKVTPAETAAVRAEFGSTARVISAPVAIEAIGYRPAGSPLPNAMRPTDSSGDTPPWTGGDRVYFDQGTSFCTTGYYWSGDTMSTAGHCGSQPGFYARGNSESGRWYEGTTYTIQYGNNRIDMQLIKGSNYTPYVWAGPSGQVKEPVSGSGGVAQGGGYCTDGSATELKCTAVVNKIDVCENEKDQGTGVTVYACDLDGAYSSDNTPIVHPGDSGGPVFTANSIFAPYATGTIVSIGNDTDTYVYWSDMYMEKVIFGGGPNLPVA
jgi:hypothetical protein